MYAAHTSTLPFKDNLLRSKATTCDSTLARTSNQFRSSGRPGPNHTPERPWKGDAPPQAPNRKPSVLSKLTFVHATFSYLSTAIFTAIMSRRLDTNTVMSSANAEILARTLPVSKIPRRAGQAPSSLSFRSRGSKAKT